MSKMSIDLQTEGTYYWKSVHKGDKKSWPQLCGNESALLYAGSPLCHHPCCQFIKYLFINLFMWKLGVLTIMPDLPVRDQ